MPEVSAEVAGFFVTQGFLGISVYVLARVVRHLHDQNKEQREGYEERIAAIETRHATEIAAERRLNHELQQSRLSELRTALDATSAVSSNVNAAIAVISGRQP